MKLRIGREIDHRWRHLRRKPALVGDLLCQEVARISSEEDGSAVRAAHRPTDDSGQNDHYRDHRGIAY